MSEHTPGPWRIGDAGHTVFGPPQGLPPKIVATKASRADARLIAAAPELLDALEKLAVGPWMRVGRYIVWDGPGSPDTIAKDALDK